MYHKHDVGRMSNYNDPHMICNLLYALADFRAGWISKSVLDVYRKNYADWYKNVNDFWMDCTAKSDRIGVQ